MTRKVIMVTGMPGTGKSTLFRAFMSRINDWESVPLKNLAHHLSKSQNLVILGKYEDGEVFPGTDRLGLNVQPYAKQFLIDNPDLNVLFEGDRLGNQSFAEFISELPNTEFHIIKLNADSRTLSLRYKERGSDQSEQFLRGRETKIAGITRNFFLMSYIEEHTHETPEDTQVLVNRIRELLEIN